MSSTTIPTNNQHYPSPPEPESPLGPRKTLFVLVTVVGCIAILWPKIFYPMMFSSSSGGPPVDNFIEKKGFQPGGKIFLLIFSSIFIFHYVNMRKNNKNI